MVKKLIVMVLAVILVASVFALTGCENEEDKEMKEILKQFDLTDSKATWMGSVADDFTDDLVIVVLRKTSTYPELKLRHFGLENAESLEYSGGVRPPDYFFTAGYEEMLENYRQIVFIRLKPQGKEKIVETIRQLEKLDFVKSAEPNALGYPR